MDKIDDQKYSNALGELLKCTDKVIPIPIMSYWLEKHNDLIKEAIAVLSNSCCKNKPCINMVENCEYKTIQLFKTCFGRLDELAKLHQYEKYFKEEMISFEKIVGDKTKVEAWVNKSESIFNKIFILFFPYFLECEEPSYHVKVNFLGTRDVCFYIRRKDFKNTIEFLRLFNSIYWGNAYPNTYEKWDVMNNPNCFRVIKTARDLDSINENVKNGLVPLFRKITVNPEIGKYINIYQNKKTGAFVERNHYCRLSDGFDINSHEIIIENIHHYQYNFRSSYAAYCIPKDLSIGEQVFIEDFIEDFVGSYTITYSGKTVERAVSGQAIWNGKDLEVLTPEVYGESIY